MEEMNHIDDAILGSQFAIASILLYILGSVGLGEAAQFLAICSAILSLYINYPKIKKRTIYLYRRFIKPLFKK
jgi:hypothetical protein